ncbi:MAG: hypothetical protein JW895_13680 [Thermoleophilaceae bacterium]|nr:hypothetical protein [Thermoleophilaceae bacterium]
MGRRSRKRGETTRAERDAARRARAADPSGAPRRERLPGDDRPPAPWGGFPLSELVILLGIVLMGWGFVSGNDGRELVAAGLVVASLGGGELALREHLAGYRSHSTLLAGVAAFVAVTVVALAFSPVRLWLVGVVGVAVFGTTLYLMRELFRRRSGGLGFR